MSAYDGLFEHWSDRSQQSAKRILSVAFEELGKPQSIVDVGCGVGAWLRAAIDLGVPDVLGVDGDYVPRALLRIPSDRFVAADLREPLVLDRVFDLALSMEVGEHLPPEAAGTLVASLVRLAPRVLFSAAPPGQGGIDHINEQWPSYWGNLFAEHGYRPLDLIRDSVWLDGEVDWWYRQNSLVFVSPSIAAPAVPSDPLRPVVHPQWVDDLAAREATEPRLKELLPQLPGALRRFGTHHARRLVGTKRK